MTAAAGAGGRANRAAEFGQLVANVISLQTRGEGAQALECARQAEVIADRAVGPISLQLAQSHASLGVFFFRGSFFRRALQCYERALVMANTLDHGAEDLLASLSNNLGQVHGLLGQLAEAETYLQSAVALHRVNGDPTLLAFALDNLALVRGRRGGLAEAEAMHNEALAILRQHGDPFDSDVATTLGNLSIIYERQRDFERAEAYRLRAFDAHQRRLGPTSGRTLIDVANLIALYWKGDQDTRADALVNYLLSLGGAAASPEQRNLAETLRRLQKVAFHNFRLDLAERLSTRAVELLEVSEGPAASETLEAIHELANVHRAVGDREAAEKALHRARLGYEGLQRADAVAAVTADLSKLYRDAGAYSVAGQVLEGVLTYLRSRPDPNASAIASALGNLALVHYESERYEAADATLAEALVLAEDSSDRAWLLHSRAMLRYHLADHRGALDLYLAAKVLWTKLHGPDHPFVATAAANIALVHWAIGDANQALACFEEAETLGDHEMRRVLAIGSEKKRIAYAREQLGDLYKVVSFCLEVSPASGERAAFAAQMLIRRKGRVLDAIAHTLNRVRERLLPEDAALLGGLQAVREEMAALMTPSLTTRRPPGDSQRLRQLRADEERLEAQLSYRAALVETGLGVVTLDLVRGRLVQDQALVDLLRYDPFDPVRTGIKGPYGGPRYAAVILRLSREPQWFDLGPADAIDTAADKWRKLLRNPASNLGDLHEAGASLYRQLVEPLQAAIQGARHILVSPDGKLVLIPFGMLPTRDGRLLQDDLVVSYLASGRDLVQVDDALQPERGILVFAAPEYDIGIPQPLEAEALPEVDREYAPLPATAKEAKAIARLFYDVTVVIGPDATTQTLRRATRPAILHIATHGFFREIRTKETHRRIDLFSFSDSMQVVETVANLAVANPMYGSGLALAGANLGTSGVLTGQEIAGMDLRGTALAVLSACDTGLGNVDAGAEFTGLRRALAIAGAQTQVTSLWRVDDPATCALMGNYYRLLADGEGRAKALQLAQKQLAADYPKWRHPAFWAAFVSAGAFGSMGDLLRRRRALGGRPRKSRNEKTELSHAGGR